ncbi:hypothetical protein [Streptomyces lydicus]|uniref:hypothetical protein n=1 Tax=Streptomyces lydicus TaxID=47763 RepID=UPI0037ABCB20
MDVVTSGTVLGAKPTDSPDRVTAILGSDFAENSLNNHSMWRDFGMADFSWVRESPDSPWEGHHFTLQVHRLSHWSSSIVNTSIRQHWQPASQVSVMTFRAHPEWQQRRRGDDRIGDVHAIHSSVSAEQVARNRERHGRQNA